MTPELQPGDFLLLRRGAPGADHAYGHIVITGDPRPEGGGRLLLKRIVGLPGEALRVGGGVQVNGRRLIEPYAHGDDPVEQHRGVHRLAEDTYFLLGDHRGASTDSRDFGPVARERITGTAVLRYWPPASDGCARPPDASWAPCRRSLRTITPRTPCRARLPGTHTPRRSRIRVRPDAHAAPLRRSSRWRGAR